MKTKHLVFLVVVLLVGAGVALYLLKHPLPAHVAAQPASPANSPKAAATRPTRAEPDTPLLKDKYGRFAGMSVEELMRQRPKMHATKSYPPITPEEVEMWQWWHAIDKADPSFEWKMPVEFYGKIVDQRMQPVSDATVMWQISVIGGTHSGSTTSGVDGRFALSGLVGKGITVTLSKIGYRSGNDGRGDFEYAAFHADGFYIPDPNNPVLFHLQKLDNPEPMYLNSLHGHAPDDGTLVQFDLKLGKVVSDRSGDLMLKFTRHERPPSHSTGYTITIEAPPGGGLITSKEEFMYSAPETGYQSTIQVDQQAKQGLQDYSFRVGHEFRFYLRTPDGKYAAVIGNVSQSSNPFAGYDFLVYYNPSGSRNLEFDDKKRLPTPDR